MLQAEARLSSFVLPKAKSHGDTARSRKSSFVAVVGFCDLQNEGKRVERAKGKEPGVSTEQSSEASEKSVVVVGHGVTKIISYTSHQSNQRRHGVPSEGHTRA